MQVVKLVAQDGTEFEIDKDGACWSETIKAMLDEDWSPEDAIPLDIESSVLARIIEFFTYRQSLATIQLCKQQQLDRNSWNTEFMRVDDEVIFKLIDAARYLQIDSLVELACEKIAEDIKACNTPEELRERFDIKNDFTREEEAEVRRQNEWCRKSGSDGRAVINGVGDSSADGRVDDGDGSADRGGGGVEAGGEGREMTEETLAAVDAARAQPDFDEKVVVFCSACVHKAHSSIHRMHVHPNRTRARMCD
jgi:S-phase kinase-associated protein 1